MPWLKKNITKLSPGLVAGLYAAFGVIWILTWHALLKELVSDPVLLAKIQILEGLIFLVITGLLFYVLLSIAYRQIREKNKEADFQLKLLERMEKIGSIGAWQLDLRSMELRWSDETYRIHEIDPSTPITLDIAIKAYAPEARIVMQNIVQEAMEKGTPWDIELPFITAKGRRLWVRSQGEAMIEDGKTILLQGTFQDISTKKFKETELQALLLQQKTLLGNTTVGVMQVMFRNIVSCNRRFEEILGYGPGELDGQSTQILFADSADFEDFGVRAYGNFAIENKFREEIKVRCKDGRQLHVLTSGCAIDPSCPQEGSIWSYIDLSETYVARQHAQKLLAAVEQSPASIVITDVLANIEYINPAFLEITGYTREEVIGQNPRMFKSGDTSTKTYQVMWETLTAGENWKGILKNRKKNGAFFWERVNISPIYDQNNQLSNYLAIKQDVTELHLAEEKLIENSQRFEQLSIQSRTVIWEIDTEGLITFVSQSARVVFGYSREEMEGKMYFYNLLPEKEREQFKAMTFAIFERLEVFNNMSHALVTKSGETIWVSSRGNPLVNADGSLRGYQGSDIDITESYQTMEALKQSQEKFELSVRGSNDGIWDWNPQDDIAYFSPRWKEQLGYADAELSNDFSTFVRLLHPDDRNAVIEQTQHYLNGSEPKYQAEFRMQHKDGSWRWILARGEAFRDDQGLPVRMAGSHTDITLFKELLDKLKEKQTLLKAKSDEVDRYNLHLEAEVRERTADLSSALERAQIADKMKDEFLANVSHELRTPLNVVIGLSDLARRIASDGKVIDYLDRISGAGKNLAGIINDLLDLSKIAAGHLEFESIVFSPRQLIERSHTALLHKAEEKGLLLVETVDNDLPELLIGDPMRIEQILLNLISNAIKFTSNGRVDVRIHKIDEKAGKICLGIEVEDTGIGISAADREKLFKPFSQAEASITRKFGGTGLGLTICKRLAEMMDGGISVDSGSDVGSIFRVFLWVMSKTPDAPILGHELYEDDVASIRYSNVHVLAVDDQPDNLAIVSELLKTVGIKTHFAQNGLEALNMIKAGGREAFDLVLMDMQMPIMDGRTASEEIRKLPEFYGLPIIAMTAHTMTHEKKMIASVGINDHIGKPFETAYFFSVLAKWIPRIKQHNINTAKLATPDVFPEIAGIDTTAGLSRFANNAERYQHWLVTWSVEASQKTFQLAEVLKQGRYEEAQQILHALRGRAGMLGISSVHAASTALEAALDSDGEIKGLLEELNEAVNSVRQSIRQVLGYSKT